MPTPLRLKIAQLFVAGFQGTTVTPSVRSLVEEHGVGGLILFRWNVESLEQCQLLCDGLHQAALERHPELPLFVGMDQEWGIVNRLPHDTITPLPGMMALGAMDIGGIDEAFRVGEFTGKLLRTLGVNVNYAPVMDLATEPLNRQLKTRSFGARPNSVLHLGEALCEGLICQGVFPCMKHFPGLGDAVPDTHLEPATIDAEIEVLAEREMLPFLKLIDRHYGFLMVGHAIYPGIDSSGLPASLSPRIVTGILRHHFGYDGVICTDDLNMEAITSRSSLEEAAKQALLAGADQLFICQSEERVPEVIEYLANEVQSGAIDEAIIDRALERVIEAKALLADESFAGAPVAFPDLRARARELATTIAKKSLTPMDGDFDQVPVVQSAEEQLTILVPRRHYAANLDEIVFVQRFRELHGKTDVIAYGDSALDLANIAGQLPQGTHLVILSHDAAFHPGEAELLNKLIALGQHGRCCVASMGMANDDQVLEGYGCMFASYSLAGTAQTAMVNVLMGEERALGTLPFSSEEEALPCTS